MRLIDADEFDKELLSGLISQALEVSHRRKYTIGEIRGMIQKRQTVDATPVVHGKWVEKTGELNDATFYWYECSNCEGRPLKKCTETILSDYCPWCGAKMDEKIDSKEIENGK